MKAPIIQSLGKVVPFKFNFSRAMRVAALLIVFDLCVGAFISPSARVIERAVRSIIVNQSLDIDIQLFIERRRRSDFNLNSLLGGESMKPITVSAGKLMKSQRTQLVVMVIDDLLSQEEIDLMRVSDSYLIVPSLGGASRVAEFFNHTWERARIVNINILISSDDGAGVNLLTFHPFAAGRCSDVGNVEVINKFNENAWEGSDFFPPKLGNFHRCALKVGTQHSAPAAERIVRATTHEYVGSDIGIVDELARVFNFTNIFLFDEWWGSVYENGSGDFNLGKLLQRKLDYVVGWHFLNLVKSKFLDFTHPYFFVPFVIVIPAGTPYTSLENLVRCFTPPLWISFIASCLLFYLITFIINYVTRRHGHYELLLLIILGECTAKRLPPRHSIRLIVMTFVIFCFIMRTAYVSQMFNLLQSGSDDREINSLEDLRKQKFVLYMPSFIESYIALSEIRYDSRYIKILAGFDDERLMRRVFDSSFRGAFVEPLDIVIRANENSSMSYNVLAEPLLTTPVVIYFQRNSYLRNAFDTKLQQMLEAGLVELWINQRWRSRTTRAEGGGEPKVLSLSHLSAAFTITIGGIALSLIAFVAEIYCVRLKGKQTRARVRGRNCFTTP